MAAQKPPWKFRTSVGRPIVGFFVNLTTSWILKPLATAFSVVFMYGFHALVKASPGRAFSLMKEISKTYFALPEEWAGFISGYFEQMTGEPIPLEKIIGTGGGAAGKAATEQIGKAFLHPMLNMIMPDPRPDGGIHPEDGVTGAERFLGVNMHFQISAWLLHVLGDMQSFGIFKSLKDLPNAISWSFGIGWLSWLVMGTPFRMGIAEPLEEHFNRVYKPQRLNVPQNMECLAKGLIDSGEFVDNMRYLGWTDDRIEQLYAIGKKDPGEATLKKLYNLGIIDDAEVRREIRARGYSDSWSDLMAHLVTSDRELDQRDDVVKESEDLYVLGVLTESSMRDVYSKSGWKTRETDLAIVKLETEKTRRSQLSNTDLANAVEKDLMAWSESRGKLMARGYDRRDADIFMKLRIPKEKWVA